MKATQSLTAAITAAALVAGAGFAYAQTANPTSPTVVPGDTAVPAQAQSQGTTGTMQSQPSGSSTGTSVDSSTSGSMNNSTTTDTTLAPRADRN